mmetsp:Transcript_1319/g.1856  ORF Transcript_1319/g.1856 Transcript_1319/m.1856 type:complete len:117 (+) Transcript_1319:760-1110(+)
MGVGFGKRGAYSRNYQANMNLSREAQLRTRTKTRIRSRTPMPKPNSAAKIQINKTVISLERVKVERIIRKRRKDDQTFWLIERPVQFEVMISTSDTQHAVSVHMMHFHRCWRLIDQ